MARESPTRSRSAPDSSTIRAPGASYAVTMTSGSDPDATLRDRMAGAVTRGAIEGTSSTPSSAPMAASGFVKRTHYLPRDVSGDLRQLRPRRERPRAGPPRLRHAGGVGHRGEGGGAARRRVVVLRLPHPLPPRGAPRLGARGRVDGDAVLAAAGAAEHAHRELAVRQRRLDPRAEPSGQLELALVAAVLPLVAQVVPGAGAAHVREEPERTRPQLDGDVAGHHGRHGRHDDDGVARLVHVHRHRLRPHVELRGRGVVDDLLMARHEESRTPSSAIRASLRSDSTLRRCSAARWIGLSKVRAGPASGTSWRTISVPPSSVGSRTTRTRASPTGHARTRRLMAASCSTASTTEESFTSTTRVPTLWWKREPGAGQSSSTARTCLAPTTQSA